LREVLTSTRLKIAFAGVAALDTFLSGAASPHAHRFRVLTKPLLMPLLAGSLATAPGSSSLRTPVLAAQAFGWVGDVSLLSEKRKPFLIGTAGFALGHFAYVAGFSRHRASTRLPDETSTRALAGIWAASAPLVALSAARRDRKLGLPVAAYSATLTAMAISANRLSTSTSPIARRFATAGSLLFLASDSTLGLRKFVLSDPPAGMEPVVMATYTAGQFLLSEAAARA
jgi:uncharacterized membrane protein YhhN